MNLQDDIKLYYKRCNRRDLVTFKNMVEKSGAFLLSTIQIYESV